MSEVERRKELGRFLRSRRQALSPSDAGLNPGEGEMARRRTKGLRREEIATLSGISLAWYTRLEQGQNINVSEQVLDSLVRVLKLNKDEQEYLYFLANKRSRGRKTMPDLPVISDSIRYLLDQFPLCPAYITDEKMNVLAWNELADAVFGPFEDTCGYMRNIVWRMFMIPSYRSIFVQWESLAGSILGEFRSMYARHIEDPWYTEFVAELMEESPRFAEWWESYKVVCMDQHPRVMVHPEAGYLNLTTYLFPIEESKEKFLMVFTPDLQDGSVERLASLLSKNKAGLHA